MQSAARRAKLARLSVSDLTHLSSVVRAAKAKLMGSRGAEHAALCSAIVSVLDELRGVGPAAAAGAAESHVSPAFLAWISSPGRAERMARVRELVGDSDRELTLEEEEELNRQWPIPS